MRATKLLVLISAGAFAILGVLVGVSSASLAGSSQPGQSVISPEERASRDSIARAELAKVRAAVPFKPRLPSALPAGYTYDRVIWEPRRPETGFSVWLFGPDTSVYGLHIIQAPYVANAPKETLKLPGLTPITLRSGTWQTLQKPDEPWKGLWIFVMVQNGVHIEVDGPRQAVIAVADAL